MYLVKQEARECIFFMVGWWMAADDLALLCLFMSFSWHVFEHYSEVGKEITKIMEACHSLILQQYSHFQLWSVPSIQSLLDLELVGELTACIVDQLISWLSTTIGSGAAERWILSCRAWLICPCILISSLTHAGTVIATWVGAGLEKCFSSWSPHWNLASTF